MKFPGVQAPWKKLIDLKVKLSVLLLIVSSTRAAAMHPGAEMKFYVKSRST